MARLELEYLRESGRTSRGAEAVLDDLASRTGSRVSEMPFAEVVSRGIALSWTRDPFDRLIVGHAAVDGLPLVTRDRMIRAKLPQRRLREIWLGVTPTRTNRAGDGPTAARRSANGSFRCWCCCRRATVPHPHGRRPRPHGHDLQRELLAGDEATLDVIRNGGTDVVLLQETTEEWQASIDARLADVYPTRLFRHCCGAEGLAVLSRLPVHDMELAALARGVAAAWRVVVRTPSEPVQILNVHLRPAVSGSGRVVSGAYTNPRIRRAEIETSHREVDRRLPTLIAGDLNEGESGHAVAYVEGAWPDERLRGPRLVSHHVTLADLPRDSFASNSTTSSATRCSTPSGRACSAAGDRTAPRSARGSSARDSADCHVRDMWLLETELLPCYPGTALHFSRSQGKGRSDALVASRPPLVARPRVGRRWSCCSDSCGRRRVDGEREDGCRRRSEPGRRRVPQMVLVG